MAANSPFLRPLATAAGGLGTVQAITWGILSLLGILLYTGDIKLQPSVYGTPDYRSDQFQSVLFEMYFSYPTVPRPTDLNIMTPGTVVVWTSIYFATSVIWLVISSFLLYESYNYRFTSKVIIGWVTVSGVIAAIDFACTVTFGVDYDRVKNHSPILQTEAHLAPIFMMIMCARGFILWIINVGLVIYLGVAASKLHNKGSPKLLKDLDYSSHLPSSNNPYHNSVGATMYISPKADSIGQGRQNTAFQPDATYGWATHSPTVSKEQPSQRDYPQQNSFHPHGVVNPIQPIPRAITPLPIPVDPLPTPQPDYSPPPQRQKREPPNMYEHPRRSVLKKSNSQRQSHY